MRLISQDGQFDFCYEYMNLQRVGGEIRGFEFTNAEYFVLANYDSELKAKRALSKLHAIFLKVIAQRASDGKVCLYTTDAPKIFQFPMNDEIEG